VLPIDGVPLVCMPSEYPVSNARALAVSDGIRSITTAFGVVELYSRDPDFVVAVAGRHVIQIIKKQATMTTVSLMRRALNDLSARYEKFGYAAVIEPDAQLLIPPDVRNGFNALVKRFSPRFTGAAIVYEKTGFHATAVRSVVTAINFASRASHPNHVFSDLREGLSWLCTVTPADFTTAGLTHVVQHLRTSRDTV
jgi:hypothetical protein